MKKKVQIKKPNDNIPVFTWGGNTIKWIKEAKNLTNYLKITKKDKN